MRMNLKALLNKLIEYAHLPVEFSVTQTAMVTSSTLGAHSIKAAADYDVLTKPTGSGWTPLGIVGQQSSSAYVHSSTCRLSDDKTKLRVGFNNADTSSHGTNFYAWVLWIRVGGGYCLTVFSRLSAIFRLGVA